jgi:hypothetical protein
MSSNGGHRQGHRNLFRMNRRRERYEPDEDGVPPGESDMSGGGYR